MRSVQFIFHLKNKETNKQREKLRSNWYIERYEQRQGFQSPSIVQYQDILSVLSSLSETDEYYSISFHKEVQ